MLFRSQWNDNYQELKIYYEKEGNSSYPYESGSLGQWCSIQRREYKTGKLSQERIYLLEKLNFVWDVLEQQWNESYQELKTYFEKEGN